VRRSEDEAHSPGRSLVQPDGDDSEDPGVPVGSYYFIKRTMSRHPPTGPEDCPTIVQNTTETTKSTCARVLPFQRLEHPGFVLDATNPTLAVHTASYASRYSVTRFA
jgi:hypothetical protein